MTHDILPADVDLASKLRSAGHSEDAVITTLVHRGIDRAEATQLLDDLRNGRPIKTKMQMGLETTPRRRSHARRTEAAGEAESGADKEPRPAPSSRTGESRGEERVKRPGKKKGGRFWPWVVVVLVCVGAAFAGSVFFNHGQFWKGGSWSKRFSTTAAARELPGGSGEPDTVAARAVNFAPTELALEFRPSGLHFGGTRLTRDNALKVFAESLGEPTRTIPGKEPGTVNYAFDAYGLVICARQGGENNSILLDCDAVGGATGTKAGFKGLLRVEDGDIIRAETAAKTLAGIKKLGFNDAGLASGILDGRYQDLNLVFVYLKSPGHLSAVEIDFK